MKEKVGRVPYHRIGGPKMSKQGKKCEKWRG